MSNHADDRLRERKILWWQVESGVAHATLLRQRPQARPHATVEVEQVLPDGTAIKAVWSFLPYNNVTKLVTVHFFDG